MKRRFCLLTMLYMFLPLLLASCAVGRLPFSIVPAEMFLRPYDNKALTEPDFVDYAVPRYYYASLSRVQQQTYRMIYNAIFSCPEKILVPGLTEAELSEVMLALKYDNPHIIFLSGTYQYYSGQGMNYLFPNYLFSAKEAQEKVQQMMRSARAIADAAAQQPDAFSAELYIHDTLCESCSYAFGTYAETAYGALMRGQAVCEGYSLAAKLLFDLTGFSSFVVRGKAASQTIPEATHMWNAVEVDGAWYYLDCTWDDPVVSDGSAYVRHAYFNLDEETLGVNHYAFTLPAEIVCDSTQDQFYRRQSLFCTAENLTETLERGLADMKTVRGAEFSFESPALMRQVIGDLFQGGGIRTYLHGLEPTDLRYTADEDVAALYLRFAADDAA